MTTPADLFIIRIYVTYACRFMTFKCSTPDTYCIAMKFELYTSPLHIYLYFWPAKL